MIEILLTDNPIHKWHRQQGIYTLGNVFIDDVLCTKNEFTEYLKNIKSEADFIKAMEKIDGHFSIIIETENTIFIAVDRIRTFPLFIKNKEKIIITNAIKYTNETINEAEVENFKLVYCTLENNTLLKEWQQLQAGEFAVINKATKTVTIQPYYRHFTEIKIDKEDTISDYLNYYEKLLVDKIFRYANGRKILIPLSGGADSRYLAALLKQSGYDNIECYTYGIKKSEEVQAAEYVCKRLKIKWHFIEYSDTVLSSFFTTEWMQYAANNHHYTSLPHEQDFFALLYLQQQKLLPQNAVIMNGFCMDIHAGSYIEHKHTVNLQKFIQEKYGIKPALQQYSNTWDGYKEWLVKNRLSKFIINSVGVYEYFGLDFYLPFWQLKWINFWYALNNKHLFQQHFYFTHLYNGIFAKYKINFNQPKFTFYTIKYKLKKLLKNILPNKTVTRIGNSKQKNIAKNDNNTLFLYHELYKRMKTQPKQKDYKINNIHAQYFLQNLREEIKPNK